MARLNVSVPDELATAARSAHLNVSALTQAAIRRALAERSSAAWLRTVRDLPATGVLHDDALDALDAVRDEPPTHHG